MDIAELLAAEVTRNAELEDLTRRLFAALAVARGLSEAQLRAQFIKETP